jgi:hypothetical protein
MTTLSPRQAGNRAEWRPIRDPEHCTHHSGMYRLVDPGAVERVCRFCGRPDGPVEPRCLALIADGSRRCMAPGRQDGLCRAHRGRSTA